MLSLAKIQEGHDSSFLILWGVSFEDLVNQAIILLGELEGNRRIVVFSIAML
jgi:hypothetical protein